jgi:hypothetical protein
MADDNKNFWTHEDIAEAAHTVPIEADESDTIALTNHKRYCIARDCLYAVKYRLTQPLHGFQLEALKVVINSAHVNGLVTEASTVKIALEDRGIIPSEKSRDPIKDLLEKFQKNYDQQHAFAEETMDPTMKAKREGFASTWMNAKLDLECALRERDAIEEEEAQRLKDAGL